MHFTSVDGNNPERSKYLIDTLLTFEGAPTKIDCKKEISGFPLFGVSKNNTFVKGFWAANSICISLAFGDLSGLITTAKTPIKTTNKI